LFWRSDANLLRIQCCELLTEDTGTFPGEQCAILTILRKAEPTKGLELKSGLEAASYLRVSRSTLSKWRMNGSGPPYRRCGPRLVYYFQDEIGRR
jgi:hypothetical protein